MRLSLEGKFFLRKQLSRFKRIGTAPLRVLFFGFTRASRPIHIVTAADSSHFRSLLALLASIERYEPLTPVSVWDLGLSPAELRRLLERFPAFVVKPFQYSKYPSYFEIATDAGCYAWKPVIISREISNGGSIRLWLDAGCLLTGNLTWIRRFTRTLGLYSPYSSGSLGQWTHPKTLDFMSASKLDLSLPNYAALIVGVDPSNAKAKQIIDEWSDLALQKDCIAPLGSSRLNHRQDQAVLSVLLHKNNLTRDLGSRSLNPRVLKILIHQDCD